MPSTLMHSYRFRFFDNMKFVILVALLGVAAASPLPEDVEHIPILIESRKEPDNGAFESSFEAGNGIKFSQTATAGAAGQSNSEGVFSYPDENGNVLEIRYVANENGFQPQGAHLPVPPAAPAHVAELLRIAEEQRAAGIVFE
ncbi:cuticle protein AMP4-like [Oratosquilla oratoria]|uniref:cuticle protein AMP4-like n=1 Tax=Oratosquilla oratoria TaxID=337810 RepID=UPI003F76F299